MDMSQYNGHDERRHANRLLECLGAIRRNKDILADVFLALAEDPPNATRAMESFEEMENEDKIAIWSLSPTAGGIWETWERHAIKTGDLNNSWDVFQLAQTARGSGRVY